MKFFMCIKSTFKNIANIFISPAKSFENINKNLDWKIPLIIFLICQAVVIYLYIPIDLEAMKYFIKMDMADDHVAAWQNRMGGSMQWRPLTTSIFLIIKLTITALISWLFISLFNGITTFRKVFILVVYANFIFLLSKYLSLLIIYLKGIETIHSPLDTEVLFGLNLLFNEEQIGHILYTIFSVIDLFAVWYLIVFFFGVQKIVPFSPQKSFVVSLVIWGLGIFFQVQLRIIGLSDYENLQEIL